MGQIGVVLAELSLTILFFIGLFSIVWIIGSLI